MTSQIDASGPSGEFHASADAIQNPLITEVPSSSAESSPPMDSAQPKAISGSALRFHHECRRQSRHLRVHYFG
ncbi:MAG: hypothetical protein ACKVK3_07545 [Acidimicrobiales bacterium]